VSHAWQRANPDLRMGGPSLDWVAAFTDLRRRTTADLGRIRVPTLLLQSDRGRDCLGVAGAERDDFAGAGPALELEDDRGRGPWLAVILAFIGGREPPAPEPRGPGWVR
jgi:lysophospholipase